MTSEGLERVLRRAGERSANGHTRIVYANGRKTIITLLPDGTERRVEEDIPSPNAQPVSGGDTK